MISIQYMMQASATIMLLLTSYLFRFCLAESGDAAKSENESPSVTLLQQALRYDENPLMRGTTSSQVIEYNPRNIVIMTLLNSILILGGLLGSWTRSSSSESTSNTNSLPIPFSSTNPFKKRIDFSRIKKRFWSSDPKNVAAPVTTEQPSITTNTPSIPSTSNAPQPLTGSWPPLLTQTAAAAAAAQFGSADSSVALFESIPQYLKPHQHQQYYHLPQHQHQLQQQQQQQQQHHHHQSPAHQQMMMMASPYGDAEYSSQPIHAAAEQQINLRTPMQFRSARRYDETPTIGADREPNSIQLPNFSATARSIDRCEHVLRCGDRRNLAVGDEDANDNRSLSALSKSAIHLLNEATGSAVYGTLSEKIRELIEIEQRQKPNENRCYLHYACSPAVNHHPNPLHRQASSKQARLPQLAKQNQALIFNRKKIRTTAFLPMTSGIASVTTTTTTSPPTTATITTMTKTSKPLVK